MHYRSAFSIGLIRRARHPWGENSGLSWVFYPKYHWGRSQKQVGVCAYRATGLLFASTPEGQNRQTSRFYFSFFWNNYRQRFAETILQWVSSQSQRNDTNWGLYDQARSRFQIICRVHIKYDEGLHAIKCWSPVRHTQEIIWRFGINNQPSKQV